MNFPIFEKLKKTLYSLEILAFIIFLLVIYNMMPSITQSMNQFLGNLSYEIVLPALGHL